ncbi:sporulation inhibitor of replication protein SirA [Heyndrickxia acidicola]|uniref:Sporulation inhibitor of replication protein SirA n=1 Tax=Heyndrickxia acidicola TaxID=209389 RepID=A0ABU6MB43_9BACI|nr:sporulation inhibitor of replication protein SirA [Heyndrickxia acidicola]MED1201897.1 sporulation inhibitor of replication protein SirA [Heyndrickxia acidicola]
MRTYQIYLIEEEFADYFYGRERMFFELFSQYQVVSGRLKNIIERQIRFITKPLPVLHLHHLLNQSFLRNKEFILEGRYYRYVLPESDDSVELLIEDHRLQLNAWGNYDTESIFFEELRKFDGRLLAVDTEHAQFGWIKPVKTRKYI